MKVCRDPVDHPGVDATDAPMSKGCLCLRLQGHGGDHACAHTWFTVVPPHPLKDALRSALSAELDEALFWDLMQGGEGGGG